MTRLLIHWPGLVLIRNKLTLKDGIALFVKNFSSMRSCSSITSECFMRFRDILATQARAKLEPILWSLTGLAQLEHFKVLSFSLEG